MGGREPFYRNIAKEITTAVISAYIILAKRHGNTFAQSVNQIYAVIGEEFGKSILDNTNTKIFMRCSDAETSDYVVKHFGVQNVLTGIFGSNQVTTREVEQDILRVQDVLSLQPREFYMMTYSGRFKGTTLDARNPKIKIIFPEAPAVITSMLSPFQSETTDSQ